MKFLKFSIRIKSLINFVNLQKLFGEEESNLGFSHQFCHSDVWPKSWCEAVGLNQRITHQMRQRRITDCLWSCVFTSLTWDCDKEIRNNLGKRRFHRQPQMFWNISIVKNKKCSKFSWSEKQSFKKWENFKNIVH